MPLSALALVLIAALLHAAWNIVAKKSGGGRHFATMSALMITVLWSPLGLWLAWDAVPRWGRLEWALVAGSAVAHRAGLELKARRTARHRGRAPCPRSGPAPSTPCETAKPPFVPPLAMAANTLHGQARRADHAARAPRCRRPVNGWKRRCTARTG